MRIFLIFLFLYAPTAKAQIGFNKSFDFDGAGMAFSSLEYNGDNGISIFGNLIDTAFRKGLLFASFDTLGNLLDYKVKFDSLNDVFAKVFPNSFIKLADNGGYAGIGAFFFRPFGYLTIYNNDGTVRIFVEYDDPNSLVDFFIEIVEVPGGFFIMGDKQLNDFHSHIFLMKTDKKGKKLWERLYGHPTRENAFGSIVKVNDNEYVIGGTTTITPITPQLVYNTSNFYVIDSLGNLKSSWQSQPSTTDIGVGYGLHRTETGGYIYSTNELFFGPPNNVYERKLKVIERDSQFNIVRETVYGKFHPANYLRNFKKLKNGNFLVLGQRTIEKTPPPPFTYTGLLMGSVLQISPSGDSVWNYLDTAFTFASNIIYDAVELPSGSIVACGYTRTSNPSKDLAWLVKINKDGCVDTLNCFPTSNFESLPVRQKLLIYPNPAFDIIQIDLPSGELADYKILTPVGITVQTGSVSGNRIDISSLPIGSYILEINSKSMLFVQKIMKI